MIAYGVSSSVKQRNLAHNFTCDFPIHKKAYPQTPKIFAHTPKHPPDPHLYFKNNYIKISLKTYTYKSENTLTILKNNYIQNHVKKHVYKTRTFSANPKHNPLFILKITFKSNNSHEKHHTNNFMIFCMHKYT